MKAQDFPRTSDGRIDATGWAETLAADHPHLNAELLAACCTAIEVRNPGVLPVSAELASLVGDLNMDQDAVLAGLLYRSVRLEQFAVAELESLAGAEVARLVRSVAAMATTSLLEMSNSPLQEKEQESQVENIKRMIVAMVDDARVAVVKLAERVVALRGAKHYEPERRRRIAEEAMSIFAPLAARLGIGQLKWELEDLAFRFLHEDTYQEIARQLNGKRAEREAQVLHIVDQVRGLLRSQGIDAEVYGRAKNIYSIWRKMQTKGVSFDQVHDVRAVRVVVQNLAQCYAALGVIHTTWPHVPSEFDDYVAVPKENGYRSIHSAVTLADGHTLEIQVRTREMHEDAELGVCAHWTYKGPEGHPVDGDSGQARPRPRPGESMYDAKVDWLRQVMEWHDELGGTERISTLLRHRMGQKRIYVSTPRGHVLDLPVGSTLLDFAYRVHTDVGHSCAGGTVNGDWVPLDHVLQTSQQVEVHTRAAPEPMRAWLERDLAFVQTDRARAKISSYFRSLSDPAKVTLGREALRDSCAALGFAEPEMTALAGAGRLLGHDSPEALLRAVGGGEISYFLLLARLLELNAFDTQMALPGLASAREIDTVRLQLTADNRDGLLFDITALMWRLALPLTGTTGRVSNGSGQAIISIDTKPTGWPERLKLVTHLGMIPGVHRVVALPA